MKDLLEFYMGKNTMERQNFIIENLVVEEDITNLMVSVAEPMLGEAVKDYRFTLPWNRMFEVYVERK